MLGKFSCFCCSLLTSKNSFSNSIRVSNGLDLDQDQHLQFYQSVKQFGSRSGPPGRVAQSVTCLATDACLTAYPGVASSIPARSHTFVEIDHEIISTVILLPSADSFKKGCCQLQAKVCAQITG